MQFDPDDSKIKKAYKSVRNIERVRQEGNENFKAGKYEEAYDLYTQGLELAKFNKNIKAILYSNRALCKQEFLFV